MRKHLKFAAGVGVVLAVIFLIAALVEPVVSGPFYLPPRFWAST